MTETDSDITRGYRGYNAGTNTNNDDITRGITNGYEDTTKGCNEYEDITKGYNERE